MKVTMKLTLLVMAFAMVGCNEQVSPKLQDANSSTVVPPGTTIRPNEYFFRLKDTSAPIQNYKLHRTGFGNAEAKCEVKKNIPLSNDIFLDPSEVDSDITCFFEAEELSLWHGGFNIDLDVSPNTCEYVSYSPYSFYNRIPGSSSTTLTKVLCGSDTLTPTHIRDENDPRVEIAGGRYLGCNDFLDSSIDIAERTSFSVADEQDLCRFNYQDGDKEQCDEGEITITEITFTHTPAVADPATPEIVKTSTDSRKIKCGGKKYNCVRGPIKKEASPLAQKATNYKVIYQTVKNEAFNMTREYKGGQHLRNQDDGINNIELANFRRNLANVLIDFTPIPVIPMAPLAYDKNAFVGANNYQASIMEYYAANLLLDGVTPVVQPSVKTANLYEYAGALKMYKREPYAADPYLGLKGRVSPFYTFECLDRAFETKARIRMVVRDWDRVYTNDVSERELISDLFLEYNSRQDNDYFLDVIDWDDKIPMRRTSGPFNAATTRWEPYDFDNEESLLYSPDIFPNVGNDE